jgi:LysM repeat protein
MYVWHELEPHHTLAGIALQYRVTVAQLKSANQLANEQELATKTRLMVRSYSSLRSVAPRWVTHGLRILPPNTRVCCGACVLSDTCPVCLRLDPNAQAWSAVQQSRRVPIIRYRDQDTHHSQPFVRSPALLSPTLHHMDQCRPIVF